MKVSPRVPATVPAPDRDEALVSPTSQGARRASLTSDAGASSALVTRAAAKSSAATQRRGAGEYSCKQLAGYVKEKSGRAYAERFQRDLEVTVASKGYQALAFLFDSCSRTEFDEICRGGQLRLPFDATTFDKLKSMNAEPRMSSHYANIIIPTAFQQDPQEQFGIDGDFLPTVLFGKLHGAQGEALMYIQAERNSFNPTASVIEKLRHVGDAAAYAWTLYNQGPYGDSSRTDANPMGGTDNPPPSWGTVLHPRMLQGVSLKAIYIAQFAAEKGLGALAHIVRAGGQMIGFDCLGNGEDGPR